MYSTIFLLYAPFKYMIFVLQLVDTAVCFTIDMIQH